MGRCWREDCQHPLVTSLQLLVLPSLAELQALLRRPRETDGPLETVLEAFCGDKGPRVPRRPSLNRYEASDPEEVVMQEPALPDHGLSE